MRISVYQFASKESIEENLRKITKAVQEAAKLKAKIVVFHECSLCGYPPLESKIENIEAKSVENALLEISRLAASYNIYIAVGTVRFEKGNRFNSIMLFNDRGERMGHYDKKALWGWDLDNFSRGNGLGIFEIEGIKIGFRICFDVRFPETFRELYKNNVNLCFVSFSDTTETYNEERFNTIKSHLITRAVENVMTVVSINSINGVQAVPTAVFDANGSIVKEADFGKECLMYYDYEAPEITFGMKGRIVNNEYFLNNSDH